MKWLALNKQVLGLTAVALSLISLVCVATVSSSETAMQPQKPKVALRLSVIG